MKKFKSIISAIVVMALVVPTIFAVVGCGKKSDSYTITVTQAEHGTISPETTTKKAGESQEFTITPDSGYRIASITVNETAQSVTAEAGSAQTYKFENIQANGSITATYESTAVAPTRFLSDGNYLLCPANYSKEQSSSSDFFDAKGNLPTTYEGGFFLGGNQSVSIAETATGVLADDVNLTFTNGKYLSVSIYEDSSYAHKVADLFEIIKAGNGDIILESKFYWNDDNDVTLGTDGYPEVTANTQFGVNRALLKKVTNVLHPTNAAAVAGTYGYYGMLREHRFASVYYKKLTSQEIEELGDDEKNIVISASGEVTCNNGAIFWDLDGTSIDSYVPEAEANAMVTPNEELLIRVCDEMEYMWNEIQLAEARIFDLAEDLTVECVFENYDGVSDILDIGMYNKLDSSNQFVNPNSNNIQSAEASGAKNKKEVMLDELSFSAESVRLGYLNYTSINAFINDLQVIYCENNGFIFDIGIGEWAVTYDESGKVWLSGYMHVYDNLKTKYRFFNNIDNYGCFKTDKETTIANYIAATNWTAEA